MPYKSENETHELLTDSSSTTSGAISRLAFLVSARLFGLLDSCLLGLVASGALALSLGGAGEGLGVGGDLSTGEGRGLAGGGRRARLDGWKSSSTPIGSSGGGLLTSALT